MDPTAALFEALGEELGIPLVPNKLLEMTGGEEIVGDDSFDANDGSSVAAVVANKREGRIKGDMTSRTESVELRVAVGLLFDPGSCKYGTISCLGRIVSLD